MMRPTPSIHARTPFYLQCSEFYKRHYAQISHAPPDRSAVMCARKRYCRDSRGYMPRTRRRVLHGGRLSHPSRAKPYLRVSRHIFLCTLTAAKHHASAEWRQTPSAGRGGEESDCADSKRVGHKNRSFRKRGRSVPLQLALPTDISYRRQVLLPNLRVSLRGGVCG